MLYTKNWLLSILLLIGIALPAGGIPFAFDTSIGSVVDAYATDISLSGMLEKGPGFVRPLTYQGFRRMMATRYEHPWSPQYSLELQQADPGRLSLGILPYEIGLIANTGFPHGYNDGALWAGRGVTGYSHAGLILFAGPLSLKIEPMIYYSQNADFALSPYTFAGVSEFAYSDDIDWPQRFGDESFYVIDWGQTGIRLDFGAFGIGLSAENMWWGPAIRYPILMSNAGPGFPHLDIGLGRPAETRIGDFEGKFVWGYLQESDYFDSSPDNNARLLSSIIFGYSPKWVPEIEFGFSRVFYSTWDSSVTFWHFFPFFDPLFKFKRISDSNPIGEDDADQLLSVFARWRNPRSGFEVYLEWARNDHAGNFRDLFLEPEISRAYTTGIGKSFRVASGLLVIRAELVVLATPGATLMRAGVPNYYRHYIVTQGYTHLGQLIGASIGPGSDAQYLGIRYYDNWGLGEIYFERVQHNADVYYEMFPDFTVPSNKDVEFTIGIRGLFFLGRFDLELKATFTRELNRYYIRKNDLNTWGFFASIRQSRPGVR